MILWRLSGHDYVRRFDGGYGLEHDGRWNTKGRPVTYCATSPALCVLEKLAHIQDPDLLPDDLFMVRYETPDELTVDILDPEDLPEDWRHDQAATRAIGDAWLDSVSAPLLRLPSVIVPFAETKDRNAMINHRHADAQKITIHDVTPYTVDLRLLKF